MTRHAVVAAILLDVLTGLARAQDEDLVAKRHNAHIRAETRRHMTQSQAGAIARLIKQMRVDTQSKSAACLADLSNLSA